VAQGLATSADFHFVVHNAAGMVSVQQGISITEALIRLRAYAFSSVSPRMLWCGAARTSPYLRPAQPQPAAHLLVLAREAGKHVIVGKRAGRDRPGSRRPNVR
jgi:hypothetical protein